MTHDFSSKRNSFLYNIISLNRIDFSVFLPAVLLVVISLATFFSLDPTIFRQQLTFFVVSIIFYFLFLNINYKVLGFYAKYLYIGMLVLLTALFLIGIEAKGAVRWIDVFGVRLQFSEIIKPFFIIVLAHYLSINDKVTFGKFIKSLLILSPIFFLTLKQPDLGNAIIYFLTTIGILIVYGFPVRYFVALLASIIIPFPFIFNFLHDYQRARLLTFFSPTGDPLGSSYNAIQSLISIGSGGFFGKGFGQATQSILKFLPERHTDFIFATITESLGFVGGAVIVGLFGFFLYRIYFASRVVHDKFSYLVVMGFYFLFLVHIFLNIGMNIGIVPIVGITLPFISYGGSSLLTSFITIGILSSIKFEYKKNRALEIK